MPAKKPPVPIPPSDKAKELMDKINKELGEGTVLLGSQIHTEFTPRITTGSLPLDVALGGGWMTNRWHELYGNESSGKTLLILKTIAANQALNPDWTVFWVASEDFYGDWAETCGCDLDRFIVMNECVQEDAFTAVIMYLESRSVDCVVIDSLPALVPGSEDDAAMADQQVGLAARINGKFFRKQGPAMKRSMTEEDRPITGFIVNQFRDKIGVMWGDPRTTPGGKAKNFYYSTRVELSRDEWLVEGEKKAGKKVGISIKALIKKNKTAPPEKVATFKFYFAPNESGVAPGNYDEIDGIISAALYFEVLAMGGGGYYKFEGEQWKGRGALIEQLGEDLTLRQSLTDAVMTCVIKGKRMDELTTTPSVEPKRRLAK